MHEAATMFERLYDVPVEVLVSPLALANEHGSAVIDADEIYLGLLTQLGVVTPPTPEVAELDGQGPVRVLPPEPLGTDVLEH
jgi:hypothetical protein